MAVQLLDREKKTGKPKKQKDLPVKSQETVLT